MSTQNKSSNPLELKDRTSKTVTREDPILLELPIDELPLSRMVKNNLKVNNVFTVSDLMSKSKRELLMMQNIGRRTLVELSVALDKLNLTLGLQP